VAARFAAAHRVAVETIRAGAPGVPVGLTLSMTDYQLAPGGEEQLQSIRHHAEDVFLDATGGDDFLGVQVYTRMLIGPGGWAGYEDGVPSSTWATSTTRPRSATASGAPGTTPVALCLCW